MKQNKPVSLLRVICVLFICLGAAALCVAAALFLNRPAEEDRVYVQASIERIETRQSNKKTQHDVYVSYEAEGERYEERLGYYSSNMREGQNIEIYYLKDQPSKIHSARGDSIGLSLLSVMGIIFFGIGAVLMSSFRLFSPNRKKLLETGVRVNASVTDIRKGPGVNGMPTYYILCSWYDHERQKEYRFRSGLLDTDPSSGICRQDVSSVPVYIDRSNPRRYYIDLSSAYGIG